MLRVNRKTSRRWQITAHSTIWRYEWNYNIGVAHRDAWWSPDRVARVDCGWIGLGTVPKTRHSVWHWSEDTGM